MAFALLLSLIGPGVQPPPPKPNIVLVVLDDMGFSDLGCFGGEIETPTIDRLAREGLRFSQFYVAGKCEPSRASLMSGHHWPICGRGGKRGAEFGATLGETLRTEGYRTMAIGKWHLKAKPEDRGFDRAFGHLTASTDYFRGDKSFHLDGALYEVPEQGFYLTDASTDFALRFLREERAAHPEDPFFLYLAYDAPHSPIQAPREDIARYRGRFRKGWDALRRARYERQRDMGLLEEAWELPERPEGIPAWEALDEKSRDLEDLRMAIYAAMIDRVDRNLARLMAELEELGVADQTLVLVLSDNGASDKDSGRYGDLASGTGHWSTGIGWAFLSNTPFRYYKRSQHGGGINSPLIAWWPAGIEPRVEWEDTACHLIDIMPTVMALSGASYPSNKPDMPPLPGVSLTPLFAHEPLPERPPIHSLWKGKDAMIDGGWKLVRGYGREWELFDLGADRTEVHDLFESHPERAEEMLVGHAAWLESMGQRMDRRDEVEPGYRPLFTEQGVLRAPLSDFESEPGRE